LRGSGWTRSSNAHANLNSRQHAVRRDGPLATQTQTPPPPAEATPTAALPFVAMAGASDLYEIESSRRALQKARGKEVRDFAQMMIDHHQMTMQKVTAAAKTAGLNPPPPALTQMQTQMLDQLRAASAGDFDRTYLSQQRDAHEKALALHKNYAANGDTPALRTAAKEAVSIVSRYLDRVHTLTAEMAGLRRRYLNFAMGRGRRCRCSGA
jgi:putative membrane protein